MNLSITIWEETGHSPPYCPQPAKTGVSFALTTYIEAKMNIVVKIFVMNFEIQTWKLETFFSVGRILPQENPFVKDYRIINCFQPLRAQKPKAFSRLFPEDNRFAKSA